MEYQGVIIYWSDQKSFGFAQVRVGSILKNFFIHQSRIVVQEPERIEKGCPCLFDVSTVPPKKPNDAPFAMNVVILHKPVVTPAERDALAGNDNGGAQ
jgi:hypothetical protein